MRFILLSLVLLAFVGCGQVDDSTNTPNDPHMLSKVQLAQVGNESATAPQFILVDSKVEIVVVQPGLGWMPTWSIVGGNIVSAGKNVFDQYIEPTSDHCVVTITWNYLDNPPPHPSAFN